jgi:adenosine deaminase
MAIHKDVRFMLEKKTDALGNKSLSAMQCIPKSDLHCHGPRGGHITYIEDWAGVDIPLPPRVFTPKDNHTSLQAMEDWFRDNIRPYCHGYPGHLKRWEATLAQAESDTVVALAMSFRSAEITKYFNNNFPGFIKVVKQLKEQFAPDTLLLPELTFARDDCDVESDYGFLQEALSFNFFCSLDICGAELVQPIKNFKRMFQYAKTKGLVLKAHVGEFGTADDVKEAVEELELDEVHHGTAAVESPQIMNWLARNQIQLNICPTSGIMLGLCDSYESHPIKLFFDAGIPVTLNTDDLLIFNQTLSQEYLNLYNAKLFNAVELNSIHENGLSLKSYKRHNLGGGQNERRKHIAS